MRKSAKPLYQARDHYRKSRLHDLARLLPIFGLFALMLPVLWGGNIRETSSSGLYLFGVWMFLILIATLLSRRLIHETAQEDKEEAGEV